MTSKSYEETDVKEVIETKVIIGKLVNTMSLHWFLLGPCQWLELTLVVRLTW